jgi:hypothetical protein
LDIWLIRDSEENANQPDCFAIFDGNYATRRRCSFELGLVGANPRPRAHQQAEQLERESPHASNRFLSRLQWVRATQSGSIAEQVQRVVHQDQKPDRQPRRGIGREPGRAALAPRAVRAYPVLAPSHVPRQPVAVDRPLKKVRGHCMIQPTALAIDGGEE